MSILHITSRPLAIYLYCLALILSLLNTTLHDIGDHLADKCKWFVLIIFNEINIHYIFLIVNYKLSSEDF